MSRHIIGLSIAVLCGLALAGCATTRSATNDVVPWRAPRADLGRLALICQLDGVEPQSKTEEKRARVVALTADAFGGLPGTELVDRADMERAFAARIPMHTMSDYEAVTAAREAGFDTIGLMTFHEFTGYVAIGLFPLPGWETRTTVDYELRLLDVETGRLIADTRRHRSTGGFLAIRNVRQIDEELVADLNEMLTKE